jgi:cephalosporin hydroxylase
MPRIYRNIPGYFDWEGTYTFFAENLSSTESYKAVEIGSYYGKSAVFFCEICNILGKKVDFYLVDNFVMGSTEAQLRANLSLGGFFTHPNVKVHILNMDSLDAVNLFEDNSLHFAFIDGDHRYEACKADIEAWYPKVAPNKWLSGHDYIRLNDFGVIEAVDEFADVIGQRPHIGLPSTWSFVKR